MSDEPRSEWKPGAAFAEVAEALSITTTEVFSIVPIPEGDGYAVIYTPGVAGVEDMEILLESKTYMSVLRRDADGILRVFGPARELEGFMGRIHDGITRTLDSLRLEEDDDGNG